MVVEPTPFQGRAISGEGADKITRARAYLRKIPGAVSGQEGHKETFIAALKVVRGFDLTDDEAAMVLGEWNQTCRPPWSEKELKHKIEDAQKAKGKRGNLLNDPERNGTHAKPQRDPAARIIYRASEVTPRKVEWLWPGRIPLGKLTTFAGVGGLGKTFVLCDIAARVSRGIAWPDGAAMTEKSIGQVVFVSGEDDPDDTLVPRLIELGADLTRVVFVKNEVQDYYTLADLETLDLAVAQATGDGPPVRRPPTSAAWTATTTPNSAGC